MERGPAGALSPCDEPVGGKMERERDETECARERASENTIRDRKVRGIEKDGVDH